MGHDESTGLASVVFVATVRTDVWLDMQALLKDGLESWEASWSGSRPPHPAWAGASARRRDNGMVFDVDTFTGTGLPDALLQLDASPVGATGVLAALFHELDDVVHPLSARAIQVKVYDFGIAVATVEAVARQPVGPRTTSAAESLELTESWSSGIVDRTSLRTWTRSAFRELRDALPREFVGASIWDGARGFWRPGETGDVLWVHRVPVLLVGKGGTRDVLREIAARSGADLETTSVDDRGDHVTFVPGLGTSVVLSETGSARDRSRHLVGVVGLQSAYWAGSRDLGLAVLREANGLAEFRRTKNVRAVRSEAYRIIDLHDRVTLFRALMSEHVAQLPPAELDLWERTSRAWKLEELVRQTEERHSELAGLGDRYLNRVQGDSSIRLNAVVLVLTIVNGIGVMATVIQFSQGSRLAGPSFARVVSIVVASLMLSAIVLVMTTNRGRDALRPETRHGLARREWRERARGRAARPAQAPTTDATAASRATIPPSTDTSSAR
ncbi:MAG: hypothetical protein M0Z33_01155 [Actinomycetota bacterium]|nr:hypothetical protein [Actinomycetota bacterium]